MAVVVVGGKGLCQRACVHDRKLHVDRLGRCWHAPGTVGRASVQEDLHHVPDVHMPRDVTWLLPRHGVRWARGVCGMIDSPPKPACELYELTQYHCRLQQHRILCHPVERVFRKCGERRPVVEVTHVIEYTREGIPYLPPGVACVYLTNVSDALPQG